ncbi:MAG: hypothetical protein LUH05_03975 [Candidatus Gastranaerophilales bacterium]|nr:hypothetical protein [Candidatus Gastranaerophilales bacterium]
MTAENIKNKTKTTKTINETQNQSTEDKILGLAPKKEKVIEVNYESSSKRYKITNLQIKNKPITVTGAVVESFIGSGNIEARKLLKQGASKVITKDTTGKEIYKIEVV